MFKKIYKNYIALYLVLLQFVIVLPTYTMEHDDLEHNTDSNSAEKEYYDAGQIQKEVEDFYNRIVSACFDNLGKNKQDSLSSFDDYMYKLEEAKGSIEDKLTENEMLKVAYAQAYEKSANLRKGKLLSMIAQFQSSIINYSMRKNWDKVKEITESFLSEINSLLSASKKNIESYTLSEIDQRLVFLKELALVLDKSKSIVSTLSKSQDRSMFNFKEMAIAACVLCLILYVYLDLSWVSPNLKLNNELLGPNSSECGCIYNGNINIDFKKALLAYAAKTSKTLYNSPSPNTVDLLFSCLIGLVIMRTLRSWQPEGEIITNLSNKLEQAIINIKEEINAGIAFRRLKTNQF